MVTNRIGFVGETPTSQGVGSGLARGGRKVPLRRRAARKAKQALAQGTALGKELAPDLFSKGLDRMDFSKYNSYLTPGLNDATRLQSQVGSQYDELMRLRKDKLGGLMANENTALRESMYGQLDRGRQSALRDVNQQAARGMGAGQSFAQKRALERDYAQNRGGLEQNILLANVDAKNKALDSYEGTTAASQAARAGANANVAGIRGQQLATSSAVDQFNAGQQKDEMAAKIGAISAGTGLYKDETDQLQAQKQLDEMLKFIKEQEAAKYNQMSNLF